MVQLHSFEIQRKSRINFWIRLATSRPHEFQGRVCWATKLPFFGRETAERATKSRDVDLRLAGTE